MKSAFIAILVFCFCLPLRAADSYVEVTAAKQRISSTPSSDGDLVGYAMPGSKYPVLIEYDEWIKIGFGDQKGWVPRKSIRYIAGSNPVTDTKRDSTTIAQPSGKSSIGIGTRILRWLAGESGSARLSSDPKVKKFVNITNPFLTVYKGSSRLTPIIGKIGQGQAFLFIDSTAEYYRIALGDSSGWVQSKYAILLDDPKAYVGKILRRYLNFTLALICLAAVIFLVFRIMRIRWVHKIRLKKSLLILAAEDKAVQYTLIKRNLTLAKCVSEIGFTVFEVANVAMAENRIVHFLPDGILVDWQISPTISQAIQRVLLARTSTSNIPVIFYNVPEADIDKQQSQLASVHYLGVAFSDRDLLSLVTPLLVTGKKAVVQKSIQASAIEGDIGDGNLSAIFQLIEIGRKSGSLLLSEKTPLGMVGFSQGRIIYAGASGQEGFDAVVSMLDLKKGQFKFIADKMPPSQNCNHSTLEVLMEWARRHDEGAKH